MSTDKDEEILSLLEDRDTFESGFRNLMATYQSVLYRHVRQMVFNHDDADDVIQNTFIKVYKNIARFEKKSKLYTWLYRIATNEAITFLNAKNKHQTNQIHDGIGAQQAEKLQADVYFEGDTLQLKLQKAISGLPDKQKTVFNLRYFEEMPYEEMSKILETSVGALKASYHHAAKKIELFLTDSDTF